jgi:mRNA interferase MazF
MSRYVPKRGEAIWLDFNPQLGREQAGRRPAFVVSPASYNRKVGLAIVCPITTKQKGYPFEVELPGGYEATGVVLADQIKSLDWRARRAQRLCTLPDAVTLEVLAKVNTLLR